MAERIVVVTISYLDPATSTTGTLGFTTAATGYRSHPADTPADLECIPGLSACTFRFDATGADPKSLGAGTITVDDADGSLDDLLNYVYDGKDAIVYIGDPDDALSDFDELVRWVVEQPETSGNTISFRTRTQTYHLDVAIQTDIYGGTGGVDGGSDLTGKPKPLAWGTVVNAPATLVDSVRLIYQLSSAHSLDLNSGKDAIGITVYDEGVAISPSTPYTDLASMLGGAPGAGQFQALNAVASGAGNHYGVYVRLGSPPAGQITFDGTFYPAGLASDTATFLSSIIRAGTDDDADIYSADKTAVAAAFPLNVELFTATDSADSPTYLDALMAVVGGFRGWVVPYQAAPTQSPADDMMPPFAVRWLDDPATAASSPYVNTLITGTPALTIRGDTIKAGNFMRVAKYDFAWPEWRVSLQTDRTVTIQTTGLGGSVSLDRRLRLALPYLTTSSEDATLKDTFPTAVDRQITTAWSTDTGTMQDEADRQLAVFGEARGLYTLSAAADLAQVVLAVPGDPVTVTNYPRYGCDTSRTFLLLALQVNYLDRRAGSPELLGFNATVWG